jgi:ribosomal-protein-alanine N-acetyltransferase
MNAAMKSAIDFRLKNLELKRIYTATSTENFPAIKLLEKLNFIKKKRIR